MDNKDLYKSGEKVPYGSYVCAKCYEPDKYQVCNINKDNTTLPECPKCGKTRWLKF